MFDIFLYYSDKELIRTERFSNFAKINSITN